MVFLLPIQFMGNVTIIKIQKEKHIKYILKFYFGMDSVKQNQHLNSNAVKIFLIIYLFANIRNKANQN